MTVKEVPGPRGDLADSAWLLRRFLRQVGGAVVDGSVVVASFYLAAALRFIDSSSQSLTSGLESLRPSLVLTVAIYLLVFRLWQLDRQAWQYARGSEVISVFLAVAVATGALLLIDLAIGGARGARPIPISVVLMGGVLVFVGSSLVRFRGRLVAGIVASSRPEQNRVRALIYGAGELGQHLVARLQATHGQESSYQVIGFIDDNRRKIGKVIQGKPVVGLGADLPELVKRTGIDLVILAFSRISGDRLREIVAAVQATDVQIRIVPNMLDVVSGSGTAPLTREIRVSDLLGRKPAVVDISAGETVLQDRVVVITGACGSVGSELCRQALSYGPRQLVLMDNNESGLFDLEIELRPRSDTCNLTSVVADVTQPERLSRLFQEFGPDIVFHAAAYKHVPLMERFPDEAARVNVLGTLHVLRSAVTCGAERFVLVSTDKAVEPRSIMGITKRLAEHLVLNAARLPETVARQAAGGMPPLCTAVRFGNVLGSRGSVVPTFAKQIDMGGPVTVTHPEMTRYFMDISEAAHLIIEAASLTDGGDLFMLDMGERIRIDDLARRMIRMRGLRPDVDIPIVYSGVRPGEKLHEELIYIGEERLVTSHPLIHRVVGRSLEREGSIDLVGELEWLTQKLERGDLVEIGDALRTLVRVRHDRDWDYPAEIR